MPRLCILPGRVLEDPDMTYKQLRALLAVGYFANERNGGVWASNKTLAETADLDERDLRRSLKELEDRGYIRRTRRLSPDGGDYTSIVDIVLDPRVVQPVAPGEGRFTPGGEGLHAPEGEGRSAPPKDTEERQQREASTTTSSSAPGVAFPTDSQQEAYLAIRRSARNPAALDATLSAILTGMTTGKPVRSEVLGLALMDMAANGEPFNASRIRGYIRKHEEATVQAARAEKKPQSLMPEDWQRKAAEIFGTGGAV